ncbi:Peptidoglycan L-alanyl-D-glutamate endopeptidase CwlK precursor [compost metagenome]
MTLTLDYVKSKSASKLVSLHPVVLAATQRLIELSYAKCIPIIITQGLRTIAEQNELYAQGRTKPGQVVTNAKGGYSYHNFGVAIDFALLLPDGKQVSWDLQRDGNSNREADWQEVAKIGKSLGFAWGGDWVRFRDYPHFEMTFGLTTAQCRAGQNPSQKDVEAALSLINKEEDKAVEKAKVYVNGEKIEDGFILDGRAYVPLRAVGEALGAKVAWDNKTKTATITK